MTLGGSSVGTGAESAFHPSLNALLEFVHQSGMAANKVQVSHSGHNHMTASSHMTEQSHDRAVTWQQSHDNITWYVIH